MRLRVKADLRPEISVAFRKARNSIQMSQEELAARIGSSQDAVSRWERGIDSPPVSALIELTAMLPEAERGWWREKTGGGPSEEVAAAPIKMKESETLDRKLLTKVLDAVEAAMNKARGYFSTQIRAEIIGRVYDEWRKSGRRDCSIVEKLVAEARCPSNQKASKS